MFEDIAFPLKEITLDDLLEMYDEREILDSSDLFMDPLSESAIETIH